MNVPTGRNGGREPRTGGPAYGTLGVVTDSEHRSLRSVCATAHEAASRTALILANLTDLPGVRIFQGLHPADGDAPPLPHAVSRGRRLILVESVAWPTGRYEAAADGAIHCDGVYMGQSVRPLSTAVEQWSRRLPGAHRVSAMVVVHPLRDALVEPPRSWSREVRWALAGDALRALRDAVRRERPRADPATFRLLIGATARPQRSP